ncbi:ornithine cyclodeaminase family protein [Aliikangiella sp. IMCC44359]|uniref:ornithine cyclodeaminase family protein n=1 Tax=Aliikangiella sp. IMCC44359 TaxID=3459125 RepID=UPI00403ACB6F
MKVINKEQVHQVLDFPALIKQLDSGFAKPFKMPQRQVFSLSDSTANHDAFAVLPSWNEDVIGVKAFTYFPENMASGYESLYSKIMMFDRKHGEPLALIDGTSVTFWRTAAVSALASRYLSREDSKTLLFCGTGNLASFMIKAHSSVRPINKVLCWGRNTNKVKQLIAQLQKELAEIEFVSVDNIEKACETADIISCATGSAEPLILGEWVRPGTHCDLIGNHSADRRECDSSLVVKSSVYVDSRLNVLSEAGELLIPIEEGVFAPNMVKAELSELCSKQTSGRESPEEITLFKSVGTALSDLLAAHLVFQATSK